MNIEELASAESTGLVWAKSSYSGGEGGECIEVAVDSDTVFVRDSKDGQGPRLTFEVAAWSEFLRHTVGS